MGCNFWTIFVEKFIIPVVSLLYKKVDFAVAEQFEGVFV